jgi:hypothetical protein
MAPKQLNKIFLSASVPLAERDLRFFETADIIAIRDAVRALATLVVPNAILIWGGHPAITPLIRHVVGKMDVNLKTHVTLYQSEFFKEIFPPDNFDFEDIKLVRPGKDRDTSLERMRHAMITENDFKAAIFIGGMEGILDEYKLFKKYHPKALILPVASTGAAALELYNKIEPKPSIELLQNYAYMDLFGDLLDEYIK